MLEENVTHRGVLLAAGQQIWIEVAADDDMNVDLLTRVAFDDVVGRRMEKRGQGTTRSRFVGAFNQHGLGIIQALCVVYQHHVEALSLQPF